MAKLVNNKQGVIGAFPIGVGRSPLPTQFLLSYLALKMELEETKQILLKFERREKVIELRDISREQARGEIRRLLQGGRTLYYSDIADELALDLELVVGICEELLENKEIGIDKDALARKD